MANIAVNNRVLATFVGTLDSQKIMTTFLYRVSKVTGVVNQITALEALRSGLKTVGGVFPRYVACMPSNWNADFMWLQVIAPDRYRKLSFTDIVGAGTNERADTANLQCSITRFGEGAKRYDTGGIRIPCPTGEDSIADGLITAGQLALLTSLATAMKGVIGGDQQNVEFTPQVGVPKGTEAVPRNVMQSVDMVGTAVQDTVRVMPRRTVGRGI